MSSFPWVQYSNAMGAFIDHPAIFLMKRVAGHIMKRNISICKLTRPSKGAISDKDKYMREAEHLKQYFGMNPEHGTDNRSGEGNRNSKSRTQNRVSAHPYANHPAHMHSGDPPHDTFQAILTPTVSATPRSRCQSVLRHSKEFRYRSDVPSPRAIATTGVWFRRPSPSRLFEEKIDKFSVSVVSIAWHGGASEIVYTGPICKGWGFRSFLASPSLVITRMQYTSHPPLHQKSRVLIFYPDWSCGLAANPEIQVLMWR
ncbi:hypothetical protein BJV78DRAFT_1154210 [Lactifluus subvellereus]|nr:hypothetical protein BJV78DRAFT_1154210 [Lactifluus subvellereus]